MKREISEIVKQQKELYRSNKGVATKCSVSEATISQIINNKWDDISDKMWLKIGAALGWKKSAWQVINTHNTKMVCQVFDDAKEEGMWMAISNPAGSSKTASCNIYMARNQEAVFQLKCWEWGKKEFAKNLSRQLGLRLSSSHAIANDILRNIVAYFKQRVNQKPLLIIDEADKLKPEALRLLIPLYNELEGQVGVVILGTENLRKEIKRGVNLRVKGYDEIDSRFGRSYISLIGATKKDVIDICKANGVTDQKKAMSIFKECSPVQTVVGGKTYMVVQDMRRIKRAVQRELKKAEKAEQVIAG